MLKTYTLITLISLSTSFCYAQKTFKPGYVVNLKGDTVKGYIEYHQWDNNPAEIHFKSIVDDTKAETYSLNNATAFAVNGLERYQRFTVPVSADRVSVTDPIFATDTVKPIRTVFMKTLIKGDNITLYNYSDDVKARYYYAEASQTPVELNYWVYKTADNEAGVYYNRRYRVQLNYLSQKYKPNTSAIINAIENAGYRDADLIKIIKLINNNTTQISMSDNSTTQGFIGGGISYSSIKFTGNFELAKSGTTTSNTPMPYITAGLNFYINKTTRKLYFSVDATLFADQHKIQRKTTTIGGLNDDFTLDYKQYTIAINPQVGVNIYSKPGFKFFVNAGASLNTSFYNQYKFIENYAGAEAPQDKYPKLESFWTSFNFKAGLSLKRIGIYAGYYRPSPITDYASFAGKLQSVQLGVHYFLKP
jgi:hypothetical protein